jgi:murein hydrolase activator
VRRTAELAAIAAALVGLLSPARADEETRATVAATLAAQRDSAARAHEIVDGKRIAAETIRAARARAAYKLLRGAGSPLAVTPERRMAVARGRATARLLLARDRAEAATLTEEAGLLAAAIARIERDLAAAASVATPAAGSLRRPVDGDIVRRFGTLVHEPSRATLARRGLDFDAAESTPVIAPVGGTVRYAGPIRGLDHGVIIEAPAAAGGLIVVVAKLAATGVAAGAEINPGDPLGTPARRRVYLETRLPVGPGGAPIDPEPLLAPP